MVAAVAGPGGDVSGVVVGCLRGHLGCRRGQMPPGHVWYRFPWWLAEVEHADQVVRSGVIWAQRRQPEVAFDEGQDRACAAGHRGIGVALLRIEAHHDEWDADAHPAPVRSKRRGNLIVE